MLFRSRRTSEQSVAPGPRIHAMGRRCADAVSGIARRTSSSGPRNRVGSPAVQQNATLKPAAFEVRHEISSNFSAFCLPNAVPLQQNHSVSGSEISGWRNGGFRASMQDCGPFARQDGIGRFRPKGRPLPQQPNRPRLAESGMAALQQARLGSCRSHRLSRPARIDPKRPLSQPG